MPVELLQLLISLEKGFLHGRFGIFRVLSYLLGNPEQLNIVSLHELLEGRNISASARLNQRRIVVWHVCRACNHCRFHRAPPKCRATSRATMPRPRHLRSVRRLRSYLQCARHTLRQTRLLQPAPHAFPLSRAEWDYATQSLTS